MVGGKVEDGIQGLLLKRDRYIEKKCNRGLYFVGG